MFYIVGTAIGNIEDTSLRAAKTLSHVDVILAEDTRSFGVYYKRLKGLFGVKPHDDQKIISFHDQNEFDQTPYILKMLDRGKDIALVSESGMPLISDPGRVFINRLMKTDIKWTVIPGPTAFVNATVLSGFPTDAILYLGFIPKKQTKVTQLFKYLSQSSSRFFKPTIVFYESPHRINKTLEIIANVLPNVEVAVCREMTKKFEETIQGNANELKNKKFKGELTVVLSL